MARIFLPSVALVLIIISGVVHGFWTDRWRTGKEAEEAAARVEQLPLTLGDWQGKPIDFDTKQLGPVSGYLYRSYVNRGTGATVFLALATGRSGPVSIHTPDVCFVASGFEPTGITKIQLSIDPSLPPAELQTAQFVKNRATEQKNLRVFWSWNAGGIWQVSDTPRLAFARYPLLYKLHVVREMAGSDEPTDDDPCIELIQLILSEMHKSVLSTG